eukprot:CAMPEP_0197055846 /NCGR_PEP_ID=MMETSP1384-20130603/74037_1 /TAXON_ID=29189 /ORGANISM="Ammonia sp." /LENGTH=541 /DNA_ID=CAMNT_0042489577 /DNA_START=84 /DNA_END=1709 /DNA_ORIENTATION=-
MKKKRRTSKKTNMSTNKIIKKKKKAFAKKAKKTAKQMIALGIKPRNRHKLTQLAVPNLCPYKKELIRRALRRREEVKEELLQKKAEKKERHIDLKKAMENCKREQARGLMVPKSLQKTSWGETDLKLPKNLWEHKHLYFKELNQVIANSDVIVEVLDARDPEGCRSKLIEKRVICGKSNTFSGNKKLILLINKIDLIPSSILEQWMKLLKREYPVIAFKASTQSNKRKLHSNMKYKNATSDHQRNKSTTNRCIGGSVLIELLKKYSLAHNTTTPITVGFIGYPNTGKSSIINSLKRQQAVGTSSTAGFTTSLKEVKLDKMVKLIDSPGVILNDNEVETRLVLRNALKLQDIDPIETVAHILTVANHKSLARIYDIEMKQKQSFKSCEEFLTALAMKLGHLKSGGIPDLFRAAQLMVHDWNQGKIPFYVVPPPVIETDTEIRLVEGGFSEEFDINAYLDSNHQEALQLVKRTANNNVNSYLQVNSEKFAIDSHEVDEEKWTEMDDEDEDDDMDDDDDEDGFHMNNVNEQLNDIMKTHAFMSN